MSREIEAYIDGASKGNPGPSGIGAVLCEGGRVVKNISSYIGNVTNNVAEYNALIYALQEGLMLGAQSMNIKTDSQLLARQINRDYKVKSPAIVVLYNQANRLISAFKQVKVEYISRNDNQGADKLANRAIKEAIGKK